MKKYLAIYLGTTASKAMEDWKSMDPEEKKEKEQAGMEAWIKWGTENNKYIVDQGSPLGKTKSINKDGISDIKNEMSGYVVVEGESHEAAAKMFENHPHFTHFPGDRVEIMECLPMPKM